MSEENPGHTDPARAVLCMMYDTDAGLNASFFFPGSLGKTLHRMVDLFGSCNEHDYRDTSSGLKIMHRRVGNLAGTWDLVEDLDHSGPRDAQISPYQEANPGAETFHLIHEDQHQVGKIAPYNDCSRLSVQIRTPITLMWHESTKATESMRLNTKNRKLLGDIWDLSHQAWDRRSQLYASKFGRHPSAQHPPACRPPAAFHGGRVYGVQRSQLPTRTSDARCQLSVSDPTKKAKRLFLVSFGIKTGVGAPADRPPLQLCVPMRNSVLEFYNFKLLLIVL
ncbi:hypothetical protein C8R44DRAFT_854547 [Mycena epipterygia]|nr:hypothetical protein C8R44DRAFT_854547 [Mycena epipterygia]